MSSKLKTHGALLPDHAFPEHASEHIFHIHTFLDRRALFDARSVCRAWRTQIDSTTGENAELWQTLLVQYGCSRKSVGCSLPRIPADTTWRAAYQLVLGPTLGYGSIFKKDRALTQAHLETVHNWLVDLAELAACDLQVPFSSVFNVPARGYT